MTRRLAAHIATLALVLAQPGCATMKNTPQQEWVMENFEACKRETGAFNVTLVRVTPEGNWSSSSAQTQTDFNHVVECMKTRPGFPAVARPPSLTITRAAKLSGLVVPEPPVWTPGDEWAFSSESPTRRGTFTWEVDREVMLDDVAHYVIRSGTREFFYRKSDLALSQDSSRGAVLSRNTPSRLFYVWPLAVGAGWEQTYRSEKQADQQRRDHTATVTVESEETISVPGGTFRTLKLVHRTPGTNAIYYEQWYAPDVGMFVRDREQRNDGLHLRELREFRPASK
jgi:hypothetical protein